MDERASAHWAEAIVLSVLILTLGGCLISEGWQKRSQAHELEKLKIEQCQCGEVREQVIDKLKISGCMTGSGIEEDPYVLHDCAPVVLPKQPEGLVER